MGAAWVRFTASIHLPVIPTPYGRADIGSFTAIAPSRGRSLPISCPEFLSVWRRVCQRFQFHLVRQGRLSYA
jgi:hypothetical protein